MVFRLTPFAAEPQTPSSSTQSVFSNPVKYALVAYFTQTSFIKSMHTIVTLWWRREDLNLCRHSPADLQSAPFNHSGTPPRWSRRSDLNGQPADYKSAALPIELHRQSDILTAINYRASRWGFGSCFTEPTCGAEVGFSTGFNSGVSHPIRKEYTKNKR